MKRKKKSLSVMNLNSTVLIIANLLKEFVFCCCLWVQHTHLLLLTLTLHI